ncbi:MAG: hypothetical protein J5486_04255 [Bacteroidaceae bacterium]|nr:hypothetical protein [Bacteroidaceae bacterium]
MKDEDTIHADKIAVTIGENSIELTAQMVEQLGALAEDDWAAVREMLTLLDSVSTQLAIRDSFSPSPEGKAAALRVVADMKQFFYPMIGDQMYGQFR